MNSSLFKFCIIFSFFVVGLFGEIKAQDPQFLQFYSSPMFVNPALVGSNQNLRGKMNLQYRNQWPSLPGSFETTMLNAEFRVNNKGTGIGLVGNREVGVEGFFSISNLGLLASQQINISDKVGLRIGASAMKRTAGINFGLYCFDGDCYSSANTKGMIKPTADTLLKLTDNSNILDFGSLIYTSNLYFGFAVHNFNTPILSFYNVPDRIQRKYTLQAGYEHTFEKWNRENSAISLNGLWMKQGGFQQSNIGIQLQYGKMIGGIWARKVKSVYSDYSAVLLSTGYHSKKWGSNLSFDMSFFKNRGSKVASIELSFFYKWGSKNGGKTIVKLPSILTQ